MSGSNALRGKRNRAQGKLFEQMIDAACRVYRQAGIADIEKTPEPVKQLGGVDRYGRFQACYAQKGQPDYKGTIKGGNSVVFEAKITSSEKISQSVVLPWQVEALERHYTLGANSFVLISFNFQKFYNIPWPIWYEMKNIYGRKYLKPDDIPQYEVKLNRGILDFLHRM